MHSQDSIVDGEALRFEKSETGLQGEGGKRLNRVTEGGGNGSRMSNIMWTERGKDGDT